MHVSLCMSGSSLPATVSLYSVLSKNFLKLPHMWMVIKNSFSLSFLFVQVQVVSRETIC